MEQTPKEKTQRLSNTEKISTAITEINQSILSLKTSLSALEKNARRLNTTIEAQNKKELKAQNKPKKERKPCGFALPADVSDEMCDFMGRENGTKISRIEITQFINEYIKKSGLEKADNKQMIIPDEKLWKILGEDAKDKKLTHFTIQKFINRHFIKK
jgi:chromatin remodeling complex protein RSC6